MKSFVYTFALLIVLSGCSDNGASEQYVEKEKILNKPISYQMAYLEEGGAVADDAPLVAQFKALIEKAAEAYNETPESIADMTVASGKAAKKQDLQVSYLQVLEAVTLSYSPELSATFSETSALYLTLRKDGKSHAESVLMLKALLKGIANAKPEDFQ